MLETKQNMNSITPLIASIESDPRISDVDVKIFRVVYGGLLTELDNLCQVIQKDVALFHKGDYCPHDPNPSSQGG